MNHGRRFIGCEVTWRSIHCTDYYCIGASALEHQLEGEDSLVQVIPAELRMRGAQSDQLWM